LTLRDRSCGYRLLAANAAGRRTRMRRTAIRSIAAVLVKTAARLRMSISTALRREEFGPCCAVSDRTFVLY